MTDNKKDPSKDPEKAADTWSVRRPYATLDLKATEIKVTSLSDKAALAAAASVSSIKTATDRLAQGMSSSSSEMSSSEKMDGIPRPAAAATYASAHIAPSATVKIETPVKDATSTGSTSSSTASKTETSNFEADVEIKSSAKPNASVSGASVHGSKPAASSHAANTTATSSTPKPATATSSTTTPNAAAAAPPHKDTATVIVKKRGGFFTHVAASIIGAALALGAAEYALPRLGLPGISTRLADGAAAIEERLSKIEKKSVSIDFKAVSTDLTDKLHAAEDRVKELEKSVNIIPSLKEAHARLVAETKAALASASGNSEATEQILRVSKLEEKMKALSDTGANDPNAGRVAQLAALTGKVSDLETSLATQLTSLRKSVTEDVDARIASVSASSEAAKSGTQRIDQDLAALKTDTVRLNERLASMKTESDKLSENLKIAQEENTALKAALENLKSNTAKPSDVASAVAPVSQKLASIEQTVQTVLKAEEDRRSNAERIVLSLELQNLKRVLDRGQKYDAELAEVQKAAGNKVDLSALAKFKEQGVPTLPDLARDFRAAANAAIDADSDAADSTVVGRLIAGAKSIVRVRKVSHNPDDKSTEAIVGRMETALKDGELGEVLENAKALPDKAKGAASSFLDKVAARHNVDAAVAALETQLKTSLSAAPSAPQKSVQ